MKTSKSCFRRKNRHLKCLKATVQENTGEIFKRIASTVEQFKQLIETIKMK